MGRSGDAVFGVRQLHERLSDVFLYGSGRHDEPRWRIGGAHETMGFVFQFVVYARARGPGTFDDKISLSPMAHAQVIHVA